MTNSFILVRVMLDLSVLRPCPSSCCLQTEHERLQAAVRHMLHLSGSPQWCAIAMKLIGLGCGYDCRLNRNGGPVVLDERMLAFFRTCGIDMDLVNRLQDQLRAGQRAAEHMRN